MKRDRKRLLLHRLFENRAQIVDDDISDLIRVHINEYFRLLHIPEIEREGIRQDFIESWPFSPQLLQLLEDQILISTDAQETRDLIKILANLFKQQPKGVCIITAGGFSIEDDSAGIMSLLDSVTNEYHKTLREKAQRNLNAVSDAVKQKSQIPHVSNILSALWIRSLAIDKFAGAERSVLQIDITQDKAIDDNNFIIEMNLIVNNSFNIHEVGNKLIFKEEENPQAKLLAFARNDKLFQDASDSDQLAKEIRYVIGGAEDITPKYKVIVLRSKWLTQPWEDLEESDHPSRWDKRIPLVVIPENPDKIDETLGRWLKEHISVKRNTIRFLIPKRGQENIYRDNELIILTAGAILKADEWKRNEPEYRSLFKKYQDELRSILNTLFDRFALLDIWNYSDPEKECEFHLESHQVKRKRNSDAIDLFIKQSIFEPEDFNELVLSLAENNDSIARLLADLQEPRPGGEECIPWLGETEIKEKITKLCAKGNIAIDIRGMEQLTLNPGETEEEAWHRMKGKLGSGNHLSQTYLMLPSAIPSSSVANSQSSNGNDDSHNHPIEDPLPTAGGLFGTGDSSPTQYVGGNHIANIFDHSGPSNTN